MLSTHLRDFDDLRAPSFGGGSPVGGGDPVAQAGWTDQHQRHCDRGRVQRGLRADAAKWAECVTGAIDTDIYTGMMREAGFSDIQVVDKSSTEGIVERQAGIPRIFSTRITARKPE